MILEKKLEDILNKINEKKYRIDQINQGIFKNLYNNWAQFTNLSKELQLKLQQYFANIDSLIIKNKYEDNQTTKLVLQTHDNKYIETVILRHKLERNTVCVSSQIGCPLGCLFCATGTMGLIRNLDIEEIIDQIIISQRILNIENKKIKNIVFMGMGEPFLNYDNVMQSIDIINNPKKLGIGIRHITISTAGIIPYIEKLMLKKIHINLAVSLHAPNNILRSKLMPINKKYPLNDLINILKKYYRYTNKRIFYEYVMLNNINDSIKNAKELAILLKDHDAHVNLIPYNQVSNNLQATPKDKIIQFQNILKQYNIPSTIRVSLGNNIKGACGQLITNNT